MRPDRPEYAEVMGGSVAAINGINAADGYTRRVSLPSALKINAFNLASVEIV